MWEKHATNLGIGSLIAALVGGCFYKQSPLRTYDQGEGKYCANDHMPLVPNAKKAEHCLEMKASAQDECEMQLLRKASDL